MSKQKDQTTKQSRLTALNKLPRLRNLKVARATANSEVYQTGFVFGGRRLGPSMQIEEKSQKKSTKD